MKKTLIFMLLLACLLDTTAQERFEQLRMELQAAVVDHPGLEGAVELSVSETSIAEFVRALGMAHELNLTIEPGIDAQVFNNFSNAKVADVLLYLAKQYDLDIEFIGSIIAIKKYIPPPAKPLPIVEKPIGISWNADLKLIDLDLRNDSLEAVIRAMNLASEENIILAPGLASEPISLFVRGVTVNDALDKLAFSNGLIHELTKQQEHRLLPSPVEEQNRTSDGNRRQNGNRPRAASNNANGDVYVEADDNGMINAEARDASINEILEELSRASGRSYFILDPVDLKTSLYVENASYEELLEHLLRGTELTSTNANGIVLIGKKSKEGLRKTELVRLRNRPITSILDAIPSSITEGVEIKEFIELNGFVLSGGNKSIEEVKHFLKAVDQVVPLVMIEVMIVDVNKSRTLSTGIQAGIGEPPANSSGTILPGVAYDMNANTVNNLINSFNGFGLFNLGNVTSDFYMSIQALETDGYLKMRSTPQLSTLNGHEATLSIGETEYYLEVQNNIIGTQNPTVATSQLFKPVNADLSVTITPVVSSEEVVTMEIEVNQSNFTERISETAPPGAVERKFTSIIRVRDRDMVLLGGLDEKEQSRNGSGLPLISRIPVLKWLFGNRSMRNAKSKLTVFIRPTIIH